MKHALVWCRTLIALATVLVMVPAVQAAPKGGNKGGGGKPGGGVTPLTLDVCDDVVDEHDTTAFYSSGVYCSGTVNPVSVSAFTGDLVVSGPSSVYDFGDPWSFFFPVSSTHYDDGADCGSNCMRVDLTSGNQKLSFDTRGTAGRTVAVDFTSPCSELGCPGPAGDPTVFGTGLLSTDGLLNVFLDFSYFDMEVCSSTACPEAQPAFAKFWFADPDNPDITWRIDWHHLRVLRMSADTWYFIADSCDGTQVAGLSKLDSSKRKRPKAVMDGFYKIPFFLSAVLK